MTLYKLVTSNKTSPSYHVINETTLVALRKIQTLATVYQPRRTVVCTTFNENRKAFRDSEGDSLDRSKKKKKQVYNSVTVT